MICKNYLSIGLLLIIGIYSFKMSESNRARVASHAGSWYSDNSKELDNQLSKWLENAGPAVGHARAIISPFVVIFFK